MFRINLTNFHQLNLLFCIFFSFQNRCVVWTGQGQVFFYNPSTKTSIWERPEELMQRADVDKAVSNPPEQIPAQNLRKFGVDILPNSANNVIQLLGNQPTKLSESDSSEETVNKKIKIDTQGISVN
jgi:transcription elongation regulator 1